VRAAFQKFAKKYPDFMSKIANLGGVHIYRFTSGASYNSKSKKVLPYPFSGEIIGKDGLMVTDEAFINDSDLNHFLTVTPLEHVLFHELGHLYDFSNRTISSTPVFDSLPHWVAGTLPNGQPYSNGLNLDGLAPGLVDQTNLQMRDLQIHGKTM